MERIYLCAVYYNLHMGIFVYVDLNFIVRVHGTKENELKKSYSICWLCHRYLCECKLNLTCLVARLSATEIWATAIFFLVTIGF
jgi:hypothetical protein